MKGQQLVQCITTFAQAERSDKSLACLGCSMRVLVQVISKLFDLSINGAVHFVLEGGF